MKSVATPQKAEEKKEDRGLFLQLPFILIDTVDISDSAMVGFIRFCRSYLQKDKTINYHGSYRLLAKDIKQARMTCYRSVEHWVKSGLVTMTEMPDEFILTGNLSFLWEKNANHCKTHQRPKFISSASQIGTQSNSTTSQNNLNSVPNLNAAIPNWDENGKKWDTNERKTDPIDTVDTLLDTKNRENGNSAIASSPAHTLALVEDDFFLEDTPEQANFAYSQDKPATDLQEKGTETVLSVESSGYRQESKVVDPPSKPTKSTSKAKIEQQGLPLQVDLGPLVMPDLNAAWPNAETAVTVSEVLRERRYTPKSRADQLTASRKMFKEFPAITRAQFETAFKQRNDAWWREHVGLLSLADLMAKDSSKAIRLSKILERLDTKPSTINQPTSQQHVRASSPNTAGIEVRVSEEKKQSNIERWKALQAEKRARQAEQEKLQQAAI